MVRVPWVRYAPAGVPEVPWLPASGLALVLELLAPDDWPVPQDGLPALPDGLPL